MFLSRKVLLPKWNTFKTRLRFEEKINHSRFRNSCFAMASDQIVQRETDITDVRNRVFKTYIEYHLNVKADSSNTIYYHFKLFQFKEVK